MNRRSFVATISIAISAFLCGPMGSAFASQKRISRSDCLAELKQIFGDVKSAQEIGRQYLDQCPTEEDFGFLHNSLTNHQTIKLNTSRMTELKTNDFEHENMVLIQGWYFAKSEARAMALVTMVQG